MQTVIDHDSDIELSEISGEELKNNGNESEEKGQQKNSSSETENSEEDEWDIVDRRKKSYQWQIFGIGDILNLFSCQLNKLGEFPFPWKQYPHGYWSALRGYIGPWGQVNIIYLRSDFLLSLLLLYIFSICFVLSFFFGFVCSYLLLDKR
jgi:hypothetical protein